MNSTVQLYNSQMSKPLHFEPQIWFVSSNTTMFYWHTRMRLMVCILHTEFLKGYCLLSFFTLLSLPCPFFSCFLGEGDTPHTPYQTYHWSLYINNVTIFVCSFASEPFPNFGQDVISICHMVACGYAHQYWETFGNDNKPLVKGK